MRSEITSSLLRVELKLVRMRGLEPPRCRHHRLLRPARLPVPPHPHAGIHYANAFVECQESSSWSNLKSSVHLRVLCDSAVNICPNVYHHKATKDSEIAQRNRDVDADSPVAIAPMGRVSPLPSSITNDEAVIVEIPIATTAKAIAPDHISHAASARSTPVPAAIPGVVTVYELATLVMPVAENSPITIASSPALAQCSCREGHCQQ